MSERRKECLGVVWHACNPSTCQVEAGGSRPDVIYRVSLNFMRLCLKIEKCGYLKTILKNKGFILG